MHVSAQCQSQSFHFAASWHSLIWQKLLSAHAANCPVSAFPPNLHQDGCLTHSLVTCLYSLEISRPSAIAGLQSVSGSRAVAAHCRASGKPGCTSSHLMQLKRYLFTCSCPPHNFVVHAAHIDTLSASRNQRILQAKPGC